MCGIDDEAERVTGSIVIIVEAAPQGALRYSLDAEGPRRVWQTVLLAHDDAVMGAATSPEQADAVTEAASRAGSGRPPGRGELGRSDLKEPSRARSGWSQTLS